MRVCTICTHRDRDGLEAALVRGTPLRDIAGRYGVSKSAVERHKAAHLPSTLVRAREAATVAQADGLLARLDALMGEAHRIKEKAEDAGDYRTAIAGLREVVRMIELLAKLHGALDERPTVTLHIHPEWITLRTLILHTLEPYPDATRALVAALETVDHVGP